ncbi:hypothetical protein L211DRAFT_832346 [Terfezia boudieri ATCC MYA-4762]|uniref:DUF4219 domain-containing protein n=1 Tax=Terfezia boudieri ATCC MYA-4762 TaxID=1051890 RepID=A0A3N4M3P6_9PEZI|nr:hypothetical protein L211DRAFT_832346 [Terfezia boudieri ATCC MYA-4762]
MPNSEGVDVMKITKLNGTNYQDWADDMRSLLILKDLWESMHEDIPPLMHAE